MAALFIVLSACGSETAVLTDVTLEGDGEAAADPTALPTSNPDEPDAAAAARAAAEEAAIEAAEAARARAAAADQPREPETRGDGLFPQVIGAAATQSADGTWRFDVTLSSPYDTPERYADAWRVVGLEGVVFGERILTHDHANEQPFTRSLSGVVIPEEVLIVTVEGRDQVNGWTDGGFSFTLQRAEP